MGGGRAVMGWNRAREQDILGKLNSQSMLDISRGIVPGYSSTIIRGHNPSQTAASGFVDISEFGDLTYLTAAETMNIVSTDPNDADGDTGLRTVLVQGVRDDGSAVQEIVTMDGTNDVETVNAYYRVNSMVGLTVGATGWNEGGVTATSSISATVQDQMNATESVSQSSHFTIPLGQSGYLLQVELNAARISGANPEIEFKGYFRAGGAGAAWIQGFDKKLDTAATDELDIILPIPTKMVERTDIRMRTDTDTNASESRSRMYIILINN